MRRKWLLHIKDVLKKKYIFKNEYIKAKYMEYYSLNPGNGIKNIMRRMIKIFELNYENKKNGYDKFLGVSIPINEFVTKLSEYDVVSFDVFDTLILRKVEKPTDVFLYMEIKYKVPRFANQRVQAEREARYQSHMGEIELCEIYEILSKWIGIDANIWMQRELEAEKELCYANPYMHAVVKQLLTKKVRIIAVSDMYLKKQEIEQLLSNSGYADIFEDIYVSSEYKMSKGNGKLFDIVKHNYDKNMIIHIGDNIVSDYINARKHGISSWYYQNVNIREGEPCLPYGMSELVGAFCKGLINGYLNNGTNQSTPYFKYGMINGGLLTCGYCQYLNKVVKEQEVDKILFVARDGYIIKKVYDKYYHECESEYLLFSRFCSEQILFEKYTEDYIRHNFYYRLNLERKSSLQQILCEIDLKFLIKKLPEYGLNENELYNNDNNKKVVEMIYREKNTIVKHFKSMQEDMFHYIRPMIEGAKKILVVDLGWYGTGGIAVKYLLEEKYKLNVKVISALVGTNEDASLAGRISAGLLFPYAYSPLMNLYLLHWHTRHQYNIHNLLIELLFSAPYPSFLGFEKDNSSNPRFGYDEKDNYFMINEMHCGIMKFAELYNELNPEIRNLLSIQGGDAYAGFMYTADDSEKCFELFKDYKISQLSGIFGENSITTMGQIMKEDGYI